jgi:hypothetical protein
MVQFWCFFVVGVGLLVWAQRVGADYRRECAATAETCRHLAMVLTFSIGLLAVALPIGAWFLGLCTVSDRGITYWSWRGKCFLPWNEITKVVIRPGKVGSFFDFYGDGHFVRVGTHSFNVNSHELLQLVLRLVRPGTPVIDKDAPGRLGRAAKDDPPWSDG